MKIGIDTRLWNQSGVGRYIRNLVKNLLELDHNNDYILFVRSDDIEEVKNQILKIKSNNENWKIIETNIKWHTIEEQLKFPTILNKEKLDLVHFPYFSVPVFYKRPFIVTIHDLIIDHFFTGKASTHSKFIYIIKRLGYGYVITYAIRKSKKIIVPSFATKAEIIDHSNISDEKIEVIQEGIDEKIKVSNKNNIDSKVIKISNNKYFLYVGNAYPHKNLNRMIEAFIKLKEESKKNVNLKLILVGNEDFFYKRLQHKILGENLTDIYTLGFVDDNTLYFLYKHALALLAPSLMEGFGLTPIEAMNSSCLILASDIPAFREVCNGNAYYFNPLNVDDMKNKMKLILELSSMEVNRQKEMGLKKAHEFSWKNMAKQTLEIYNNSIGR